MNQALNEHTGPAKGAHGMPARLFSDNLHGSTILHYLISFLIFAPHIESQYDMMACESETSWTLRGTSPHILNPLQNTPHPYRTAPISPDSLISHICSSFASIFYTLVPLPSSSKRSLFIILVILSNSSSSSSLYSSSRHHHHHFPRYHCRHQQPSHRIVPSLCTEALELGEELLIQLPRHRRGSGI